MSGRWKLPSGSVFFGVAGGLSAAYWLIGTVLGSHPDGGLLGFSAGMFAVWSAMQKDQQRRELRRDRELDSGEHHSDSRRDDREADQRGYRPPSCGENMARAKKGTVMDSGGVAVVLDSSISLNNVSWEATGELAFTEWLRYGTRLGIAGRNAQWWIGDWLNYGNTVYGEKYKDAFRITGYSRQSLMNMVSLANTFPPSRRREDLSFSHHDAVAGLEEAEQERLLDQATDGQWSVQEIRAEVRLLERSSNAQPPSGPKSHGSVSTAVTTTKGRDHDQDPDQDERTTSLVLSDPAPDAQDDGQLVTCPHCGQSFRLDA